MESFKKLMAPEFLPEGGELAIGLMHSYSTVGNYSGDGLARTLKGGDALTLSAVQALGLEWSFMAAFDVDVDYWDDKKDEATKGDPTFDAETLNVQTDGKLVWVTKPAKYGVRNAYTSYGNEPVSEDAYAGVVLLVELPPIDERASLLEAADKRV
ncbi:hypothetical protein IAT38_004809 [Cryptococcus sp. DSM 104549]